MTGPLSSSPIMSRLLQEGRKSGANFSNWKYACHTLNSHRLIQYVQGKFGIDTSQSNAAIFQALYEEGKNISLVDTLVDVSRTLLSSSSSLEADLDQVRNYLESNEGESDVKTEVDKGKRQYRISGVPFFVISLDGEQNVGKRHHGLSGAQSKEMFLEIFEQLEEDDQN